MRAGLALAATTLVASPAFAANEEWPDGPNKPGAHQFPPLRSEKNLSSRART